MLDEQTTHKRLSIVKQLRIVALGNHIIGMATSRNY